MDIGKHKAKTHKRYLGGPGDEADFTWRSMLALATTVSNNNLGTRYYQYDRELHRCLE